MRSTSNTRGNYETAAARDYALNRGDRPALASVPYKAEDS